MERALYLYLPKTVFKNDKRYVEWLVTTDWYNFGQEIQTIPSNTLLSREAQIFNGFSEATEKMYQSEINGELKFGKIIITE